MTGTPDPTLNAKDKEFLSLVSEGDVGGEYGRFIVDDPTGAAPGHDHHRYLQELPVLFDAQQESHSLWRRDGQ